MKRPFNARFLAALLFIAGPSMVKAEPDDLSAFLAEQLKGDASNLPSLAAAVIVDGELKATGAAGVRKKGDDEAVTVEDKFHIGSCTKSFTATLAAVLVEEGKIGWDSTIGEVLGKFEMDEGWKDVTLKQLLSNTGGFPDDVPPPIWMQAWLMQGSFQKQREIFTASSLKEKPAYPPGTGYAYSNAGFSIAGVMLEKVGRKPWEELIEDRIFRPLGMKSAGFRAPEGRRELDQPWGHQNSGNPVPPGPKADNPPSIAPAGAVHCKVEDWAKYVRMHLVRETGTVLKKKESFEVLHTPVSEEEGYALGWGVRERRWAGGKALRHAGSNTMWFAETWLAPERRFAVLIMSNIGVGVAAKPCDQIETDLMEKYLGKKD